jgi:hypothetical protein
VEAIAKRMLADQEEGKFESQRKFLFVERILRYQTKFKRQSVN